MLFSCNYEWHAIWTTTIKKHIKNKIFCKKKITFCAVFSANFWQLAMSLRPNVDKQEYQFPQEHIVKLMCTHMKVIHELDALPNKDNDKL